MYLEKINIDTEESQITAITVSGYEALKTKISIGENFISLSSILQNDILFYRFSDLTYYDSINIENLYSEYSENYIRKEIINTNYGRIDFDITEMIFTEDDKMIVFPIINDLYSCAPSVICLKKMRAIERPHKNNNKFPIDCRIDKTMVRVSKTSKYYIVITNELCHFYNYITNEYIGFMNKYNKYASCVFPPDDVLLSPDETELIFVDYIDDGRIDITFQKIPNDIRGQL